MAQPLSPKLDWELANPLWAQALNPIINAPLSGVRILQTITLINGSTVINHGLARLQKGWFLTDVQGPATIYRTGSFNDTSFTLTSSAAVVVNIGVF